jgi:hypothetical protein
MHVKHLESYSNRVGLHLTINVFINIQVNTVTICKPKLKYHHIEISKKCGANVSCHKTRIPPPLANASARLGMAQSWHEFKF